MASLACRFTPRPEKMCVRLSGMQSPGGHQGKQAPELASQGATPAAGKPLLGSESACLLKTDSSIVSTGSGPGEPSVGGKLGGLWACGHRPPSLASVPERWGCAVPTSNSDETAGE